MRTAREIVFWIGCAGLGVVGLLGWSVWQGLKGEANGGSSIGRGVAIGCAVLLAILVSLRVLL